MTTDMTTDRALNVLGEPLEPCSRDPLTGFFRDGCCNTGPADRGRHVVCAEVTEAFLAFSVSRGNDLVTPRPEFAFKGLRPGDRWCLCLERWIEAASAGVVAPVALEATHISALERVPLATLQKAALSGRAAIQ